MKAYAILQGGGVKGAALAGCLKAAEELKIDFEGYGGTSAGSIIGLLGSVGYKGDELRQILTEDMTFSELLDDKGVLLQELKDAAGSLGSATGKIGLFWNFV